MKISPVTLNDIARKAGVAKSTVSLALRRDSRISLETRQRIDQCARDLDYRPNPLVGIYQSHIKARKTPSYQATLAFITYHPKTIVLDTKVPDALMFSGARKRATELGYRIEPFQFQPKDDHSRRREARSLKRILLNRGICGLVFGPAATAYAEMGIDLSAFSAVATDYSIASPKVHRVCHDYFNTFCMLFTRLEAYGYRRIGLAIPRRADARVSHYWISALGGYHYQGAMENRAPPFIPPLTEWNMDNFRSWHSTYRPDVVVSVGGYNAMVLDWMGKIGLRVPENAGFATLICHPQSKGCSGMDIEFEKIGAVAVEQLTGLLHRNERGETDDPHIHLLEGSWKEGKTLQTVSNRVACAHRPDSIPNAHQL